MMKTYIKEAKITKYQSSIFPEYNSLSTQELEVVAEHFKAEIYEHYQIFTSCAASNSGNHVKVFADAGSRLKEIKYILGIDRPIYYRTKKQAQRIMPELKHREYVETAINRGEYIPEEVLIDYPDLIKSEDNLLRNKI